LCNWFQPENNNIDVFLLMNGDIFNHPPASKQYNWNGGSAYATPPNPPTSTNTLTGEPIFVQSYINAYNTAFNQHINYQAPLYKYTEFTYGVVNNDFVPGTFGYEETYNSNEGPFYIRKLIDNSDNYVVLLICLFRQVRVEDLVLCT